MLIALLAMAAGLALARALLTLPVAFDRRDAPALVLVTLSQALVWWWVRRRPHGLARAALRLAVEHKSLALWLAGDLGMLLLLWCRGTARWSQAAPVWEAVAAYAAARAALLALLTLWGTIRGAGKVGLPGRTAARRGVCWTLLGVALAAPAWSNLPGIWPAWQSAVASGLLALVALTACARPGAARETWVGLAGALACPALALGGCAILLAEPALPFAAPVALSTLLPALGLATLATPAAFAPPVAP